MTAMIFEWATDRTLPAGSRIMVGDGQLRVIASSGQPLFYTVLPPTNEEDRLRAEVAALHAELMEPPECECGFQYPEVSS